MQTRIDPALDPVDHLQAVLLPEKPEEAGGELRPFFAPLRQNPDHFFHDLGHALLMGARGMLQLLAKLAELPGKLAHPVAQLPDLPVLAVQLLVFVLQHGLGQHDFPDGGAFLLFPLHRWTPRVLVRRAAAACNGPRPDRPRRAEDDPGGQAPPGGSAEKVSRQVTRAADSSRGIPRPLCGRALPGPAVPLSGGLG